MEDEEGDHGRPLDDLPQLTLASRRIGMYQTEPDVVHETVSTLEDDELQSVIGVSISRMQTLLSSPQTPAADKEALMQQMDGMFDDVDIGTLQPHQDWNIGDVSQQVSHTSHRTSTSSSIDQDDLFDAPKPWRAASTSTEQKEDRHPEQIHGPFNKLAESNIKRYIASLNLHSMPKTNYFKDFNVPSLGSILDSCKSQSPTRKTFRRHELSNSSLVTAAKSHVFGSNDLGDSCNKADRSSLAYGGTPEKRQTSDGANPREHRLTQDIGTTERHSPRTRLMRSLSDQSLVLRRVTSTTTSLGDDTRWENVKEQVNSRGKAIMDSLQDSSIRLPSLSSLPSLNALRPNFTRPRAQSDAIRALKHESSPVTSETGNKYEPDPSATRSEDPKKTFHDSQGRFPHFDDALDGLTGDLVILGGYRGSILRSAEAPHRQLWVPVKVGLNIRRVNLEVGLNDEDEQAMHEKIVASGMLSHIGPVDMGRRLLKRLRKSKNALNGSLRVHDYGYDWRLSPHLLSERLIEFIARLKCNQSGLQDRPRGATVIAHSMGGLLTRHAVNIRPELFAGVVYAGVPQQCINILGPLRNGDEVLLSSKVLTARTNFSIRSSFLLLPDDGQCFIDKVTKEAYPVDFFNVEDWKEHAFSPIIASVQPALTPEKKGILGAISDSLPSLPSSAKRISIGANNPAKLDSTTIQNVSTSTLQDGKSNTSDESRTETSVHLVEALEYLARTLRSVRKFRSELDHLPKLEAQNQYPPFAVIFSTNTPTVAAARVASREAIKHADAYDDLAFGSGDGVVLARAAMLPEGYHCAPGGKVKSERGHVTLLGDIEGIGKCLQAIVKDRKRGIGSGVKSLPA